MANTKEISTAFNVAKEGIKGRLDGHCQYEGVKWMLTRELCPMVKGGILADEVGLGKTMQAIATMRGNPMPTLIVTMVSLVGQWRDELIRFGGYKPIIVNASFSDALPIDGDCETVIITPYSSFQKSKGNTPECLMTTLWGRIILDEGHTIRNKNTKVFKEMSKLKASIRWILSGTPIQNDVKELWALAEWIGVQHCADLEAFCQEYVLRRTQGKQAKQNPRLALPPLDTQVKIMAFKHQEEYDMYKRVEMHYEDKMMKTSKSDNYNIIMEAIIRCRQICSHPQIYFDGMDKKVCKAPRKRKFTIDDDEESTSHGFDKRILGIECFENMDHIPSTKVEFLCDDIKTNVVSVKNNKCLVFCTWVLEMKLIQKQLKMKGISSLIFDGSLSRENKDNVLYNFKNTKIPVLILQINCGSTGLNLQCASRIYIMSPHWNPCIELQAIGRSYRKGQTNKVTCVRLIIKDTIEERCLQIQTQKMAVIGSMMMDESMEEKLGSTQDDTLSENDIKTLFSKRGVQRQEPPEAKELTPPPRPKKLRIKLKSMSNNKKEDKLEDTQEHKEPPALPPSPPYSPIRSLDLDQFNLETADFSVGLDKESEDKFWKELSDLPCVKDSEDMYTDVFDLF